MLVAHKETSMGGSSTTTLKGSTTVRHTHSLQLDTMVQEGRHRKIHTEAIRRLNTVPTTALPPRVPLAALLLRKHIFSDPALHKTAAPALPSELRVDTTVTTRTSEPRLPGTRCSSKPVSRALWI